MSSNPPPHQQQQQSVSSKSITLDDLSNHFSVPISDAANSLGVCVSVLKRICRQNGLDRWPYREVLAGKSIEDIKKRAARERSKELAELTKAGNQSVPQHQNNGNPKSQGSPNKMQQGSKDSQSARQQFTLSPGLIKGMTTLEEFKSGFPKNGLSISKNKWWGSSNGSGAYEGIHGDGTETDDDGKNQPEDTADDNANNKNADKEKPECEKDNKIIGYQLLTAVRKQAATEGREALKLGVYRRDKLNKLGRKERALLLQLFGTSLLKQEIRGLS